MRRRDVCLGVLAATLGSCRDPTEVTLHLTTDVPCADVTATRIVAGAAPPPVTSACAGGGEIGTIVLYPSGAKDAELEIEVTLGADGQPPDACAPGDPRCIVARRRLRYRPHTNLPLDVQLRRVCAGVVCAPDETCVLGACATSNVDDPGFQTEGDAGSTEPPDAARADATPSDGAPLDAPADVIFDGPVFEAGIACVPGETLAPLAGRATALSLTPTHVYWATPAPPEVASTSRRATGAKLVLSTDNAPTLVAGFGTTGTNAFYYNGNLTLFATGGAVVSSGTDVAGLTASAAGNAFFTSTAPSPGVYAATTAGSKRLPLAGLNAPGALVVAGGGASPTAFVADGLSLYKLTQVDAGLPPAFTRASSGVAITKLALLPTRLYVGVQLAAGYEIYVTDVSSGNLVPVYSNSTGTLLGMAVNATTLALTDDTNLYTISPPPVSTLLGNLGITGYGAAGDVVADDACIYFWADGALREHTP
jgi:hypothetical protein